MAQAPPTRPILHWHTVGLLILALGITSFAAVAADPDKAAPLAKFSQEYFHSFKDDSEIPPDFQWDGLDPQECVRFEPAGLRLNLPIGHPEKRMGTGLSTTFGVTGDFEITMAFVMLHEPAEADAGVGTGVYIGADLITPKLNRGMLGRAVYTKCWIAPGKYFTTWFDLSDSEADKPPKKELKTFPARTKIGRLRLVRAGSILSYLVADDSRDEFTLLKSHPFGTEDVKTVRIGGHTGGPNAALDARLLDLRIRSGALPGLPEAPDENPLKARGPRWLVVGLGLGLATILLLAVTIWLFSRRGRRATTATARPLPDEPIQGARNTPISLSCSNCGKGLKVKGELAGKKVKCPECGAPVFVPDADGTDRS